ncbi:MAG: hypothetical protein V4628_16200, partial [Pseudomonadota bacterium]
MRRSTAGISNQFYQHGKYPAVVIALLLACIATIAAAQGADPDFSNLDDDGVAVMMQYLQTYAFPRWWLTFAAMCIAPWLLAFSGLGSRHGGAAISGRGPQMADHLRRVSILGSKYMLDVYTGNVMSEKSWTETTVETTTTTTVGGDWTSTGFWQTSMSPSTHVSVSTTTINKDQVRVRYPDNSRGSWEFTNSNFIVAPNDVISLVARRVGGQLECLIGYNHDSGQFVSFNLLHAHAIAGKLTWFVVIVLGALGASWGWSTAIVAFVNDVLPNSGLPATPMGLTMWITAFVIAAVVALVPLLIVGGLLPRIRTMIFKNSVMPGVKHFL